jgi:hypothetical protein
VGGLAVNLKMHGGMPETNVPIIGKRIFVISLLSRII